MKIGAGVGNSDNVDNAFSIREILSNKQKEVAVYGMKETSINTDYANERKDTNFELATYFDKKSEVIDKRLKDNVSFDRMIIFGDSLSDSQGNMLDKSFGILPAASQYYEGRFTNGFTWADFISSPAFLNKPIVNYAEGGAVAANYSFTTPTSLLVANLESQMKKYESKPNDLVILFLGANDYMTLGKEDVNKVVQTQYENITKLIDKGVKNILVTGIPDLSVTPDASLKTQDERIKLSALSKEHNEKVERMVAELQQQHQGVKINYYDINTSMKEVIATASTLDYNTSKGYNENGYTNILKSSYNSVVNFLGLSSLAYPEEKINISHTNVFNDGVHPNQEVHWVLARKLENILVNGFQKSHA